MVAIIFLSNNRCLVLTNICIEPLSLPNVLCLLDLPLDVVRGIFEKRYKAKQEALLAAVQAKNELHVLIMLSLGASATTKMFDNKSVLDMAKEMNDNKILHVLQRFCKH